RSKALDARPTNGRRKVRRDPIERLPQGGGGVAHDAECDWIISPDEKAITIDLDRRIGPCQWERPPIRGQIAKPRSDHADHVWPGHHVRYGRSMATEADESEVQRVRLRKHSFAVGRRDDGDG